MSDVKKYWTFDQMNTKVRTDIDLLEEDPDEQFVTKAEMIGYFNEAIGEAEAEIMDLNEDYFLGYDYVPLVEGEDEYSLPDNIYLQKIRRIMYANGSTIYPVKRIRNLDKFERIHFADQYSTADDYQYYITNNSVGNPKMTLVPPARETATLSPLSPTYTPMKRWYIRNANRIPYVGDYTNSENILPTSVDTGTNIITVNPIVTYVTGDKVKFYLTGSNTLPSPLVIDTVYYVIAVSSTTIKLATTAANATAGTAIDITTTGTGYFTMKVAATDAIVDATIIDIPECSTFIMEWVKYNCLFKDGDPRMSGSLAKMEEQRKMLVETLSNAEPDDDDFIQADYTFYNEMS